MLTTFLPLPPPQHILILSCIQKLTFTVSTCSKLFAHSLFMTELNKLIINAALRYLICLKMIKHFYLVLRHLKNSAQESKDNVVQQ